MLGLKTFTPLYQMKKVNITKASGESARFSADKLKGSLMRSGASTSQAEEILEEMETQLYEGISTKQIYKMAFRLLKNSSRHLAAKYHLKRAIMELGPSGFPFEKYMAEIMKQQGYQVKTGHILQGKCVKHEIDIVAENQNQQLLIECKYHSQQGIFCDVKVPLYIHSRFNDVVSGNNQRYPSLSGWVVTNTRFSVDAVQYGLCAGLYLVGWDYPAKGSLKEMVDTHVLYPVTCLTSLTKAEKQLLLDKNKVLCQEIQREPGLLKQIGVKSPRLETVLQEVHLLCKQAMDSSQKKH